MEGLTDPHPRRGEKWKLFTKPRQAGACPGEHRRAEGGGYLSSVGKNRSEMRPKADRVTLMLVILSKLLL